MIVFHKPWGALVIRRTQPYFSLGSWTVIWWLSSFWWVKRHSIRLGRLGIFNFRAGLK